MEWMRKNGVKFRFMHEVDEKGWRKVTEEVLAELKDMGVTKVFLSLDPGSPRLTVDVTW